MSDRARLTLAQRGVRRTLSMPPAMISRLVGPPPQIDGRTLSAPLNLILGLERRGVPTTGAGEDVVRRRADLRRSAKLMMPPIPGVTAVDRTIPGPAGNIPVRFYRPRHAGGPAPVIVYYHGGGWVVGDLDSHDGTCRMLALHSGCSVVSVAYRRAPEHPFPGPLVDATAAFGYVFSRPEEFVGIPGAVAVMGDSAGANLATGVCLDAREGHGQPVAQALVYPATDLRLGHRSMQTLGAGFMLTKPDILWYRRQYLADPALVEDPRVSPLLAEDLSGLPPARIWTAGFDPLRDEGMAFAQRLREAGVDSRDRCLDDQIHGFFGMGLLPGGMANIAGICREAGQLVHAAVRRMP